MQSDTIPLPKVMDDATNLVAQTLSQIPGAGFVDMPGSSKSAIRIQLDPMKIAVHGSQPRRYPRGSRGRHHQRPPKGTLNAASVRLRWTPTISFSPRQIQTRLSSPTATARRCGSATSDRAIDSVENTTMAPGTTTGRPSRSTSTCNRRQCGRCRQGREGGAAGTTVTASTFRSVDHSRRFDRCRAGRGQRRADNAVDHGRPRGADHLCVFEEPQCHDYSARDHSCVLGRHVRNYVCARLQPRQHLAHGANHCCWLCGR